MNVWDEISKHKLQVRFMPHNKVKECIACYNVIYNGKRIRAAKWLDIPEGEIWISDMYKEYAKYILFHELSEIKHRAEGYDAENAHLLALKDEENAFKNDETWQHFKREINICTIEDLISTQGIGKILTRKIIENRPYDSMKQLLQIRGIGKKRYNVLRLKFWCIGESEQLS